MIDLRDKFDNSWGDDHWRLDEHVQKIARKYNLVINPARNIMNFGKFEEEYYFVPVLWEQVQSGNHNGILKDGRFIIRFTEEEYSNYLDALESEESIWSHPTYEPEGDRITYVTLQEMEDGSVQAEYYNQRRFLEELQNLL